MYKLKPYYITSEIIDTPNCMYKLKRIYGDGHQKCQNSTEDVHSEIAALQKRQEDILSRLQHLKQEVETFVSSQRITISAASKGGIATKDHLPEVNGVVQDIVINANPSNPPLSVLVLHTLLAQQHRVLASSYVHSSVSDISIGLRNVFSNNTLVMSRSGYKYALSLIWKNDRYGTSMMLSPNVQTRIYGEANVARYLARLLSPAYDAVDLATAAQVDHWLDQATQLMHGSNKERAGILRMINGGLDKHPWLVGSDLTLADIVMWSVLQQCKMTQAIPGNVKKWLDACSQQPVFKHAQEVARDW